MGLGPVANGVERIVKLLAGNRETTPAFNFHWQKIAMLGVSSSIKLFRKLEMILGVLGSKLFQPFGTKVPKHITARLENIDTQIKVIR
jgi:hypothetical protein